MSSHTEWWGIHRKPSSQAKLPSGHTSCLLQCISSDASSQLLTPSHSVDTGTQPPDSSHWYIPCIHSHSGHLHHLHIPSSWLPTDRLLFPRKWHIHSQFSSSSPSLHSFSLLQRNACGIHSLFRQANSSKLQLCSLWGNIFKHVLFSLKVNRFRINMRSDVSRSCIFDNFCEEDEIYNKLFLNECLSFICTVHCCVGWFISYTVIHSWFHVMSLWGQKYRGHLPYIDLVSVVFLVLL